MFRFLKKASTLYENIDGFGYRVELYFEKKTLIKSKFGATITLTLMVIFLYLLTLNIQTWKYNDSLQTIISTQSFSPQELIKLGENWNFTFSYQNYYPYFGLRAFFPNGTVLTYFDLQRYFEQTIQYIDSNGVFHYIETEACPLSKIDEFLKLSEEIISSDMNKTSKSNLCIKNDLTMGMFLDKQNNMVNKPFFSFGVRFCQNTTENKNFCASNEEIIEILNYVYVQINVPESVFDFTNGKNSRKRTYDIQAYQLDHNLMKIYSGYLSLIYLQTDNGFFKENYELDSIDFNCEKLSFDIKIRDESNPYIFTYDFQVGFSKSSYFRRNVKFKEIIANVGGIMNILILLGKLICGKYNSIIFHQRIFNSMNLKYEKDIGKQNM